MNFFHGASEGEARSVRLAVDAADLGFSHFAGINAALPHSLLVHGQHNGRGFFQGLVEHAAEDIDHKVHAGIIVIMQQDAVAVRLLELFYDNGPAFTVGFALIV